MRFPYNLFTKDPLQSSHKLVPSPRPNGHSRARRWQALPSNADVWECG
jgi:hypothetical protein